MGRVQTESGRRCRRWCRTRMLSPAPAPPSRIRLSPGIHALRRNCTQTGSMHVSAPLHTAAQPPCAHAATNACTQPSTPAHPHTHIPRLYARTHARTGTHPHAHARVRIWAHTQRALNAQSVSVTAALQCEGRGAGAEAQRAEARCTLDQGAHTQNARGLRRHICARAAVPHCRLRCAAGRQSKEAR